MHFAGDHMHKWYQLIKLIIIVVVVIIVLSFFLVFNAFKFFFLYESNDVVEIF